MKKFAALFPFLVLAIGAIFLTRATSLPADDDTQMQINEFGRLPVLFQGRVKPVDTLARNSLTIISEKQVFRDEEGNKHSATEWLLDVMAQSPASFSNQVFRIPNQQVIDLLKLPERKRFRYALSEFADEIHKIDEEANRAREIDAKKRDVFDNQILSLAEKLHLYMRLQEASRFVIADDMNQLHSMIERYQSFERFPLPHVIPPANGSEWQTFTRAGFSRMISQEPNPFYAPMAGMLFAYGQGDTAGFNSSLIDYKSELAKHPPEDSGKKLGYEVFFNNFAPFIQVSFIYVLIFLLSAFAWLGWTKPLNQAAFYLMVLAFIVHTWALVSRIYISGYPPVTNLYSSAIFIGWGCVILGIFLEVIFKIGIGNLIASVAGFLTLLVAHFLAGDGDTMQVMQAVLDTKFWLATHVTTVTLGYTATFFAGGLGILYVVLGLFTKKLDLRLEATLARMIYGIICFGLLLSFIGTVLGGLWADDSWGRFWGWDPKENGALMIVLWNGLILHARWGALVQNRGIALLAIFGNIITAWSWFGVNQLSIGLHSYGFTSSAAFWLMMFVFINLGFIGIGSIPMRAWRSRKGFPQLAKA